jgi:ATP-dependent RNA helicase DDX52/ROK1
MGAKNESSLVASKASLAFAQLCGNLAQFNAKRFGNDMEKFAKKKTKSDGGENLGEEEDDDDDDDESSESESSSSSSSSDGERSDGDSSSSSEDEEDDKISMFASAKKEKKANAKASKTNHQTEEELANIRRKKYKIRVKGDDSRNVIPAPLESFQDLETTYGCSKSLIKRLEECKWLEPTPIQRQAIPMMLRDVETLAVAPTGSGKTLAFLLPIFMRLGKRKDGGVRAILLAPTKELATQSTRICTLLSDGLR